MMFKKGDLVTAFGNKGVVTLVDYKDVQDRYPVRVLFEGTNHFEFFTEDGKIDKNHSVASLELYSRPRKTFKKKLYIAVQESADKANRYGEHQTTYAYPDKSTVENMYTQPSQVIEVELELEEVI